MVLSWSAAESPESCVDEEEVEEEEAAVNERWIRVSPWKAIWASSSAPSTS